jgi:hypothetical protein
MRAITTTCLSAFSLALSIPTADAAEPFAATGTRATLSVEYVYESAGQQRSAGQ